MENKLLGGKWEMAIGSTLIPAQLLGDIAVNYEEGTLSVETQSGVRNQPNGKASTAEITFTLYLPNTDYLKVLFADIYNEPTAEAQKSGNIIFGGNSCGMATPLPINIHNSCEPTDDNDIHVFAGMVNTTFTPSLTTGDVVSVEATIMMQPVNGQYMRLGTGDLSQPSYYDVETQTTKPYSA